MSGRSHEDFRREHVVEAGSVASFAWTFFVALNVIGLIRGIAWGQWEWGWFVIAPIFPLLLWLVPGVLAPLNRAWSAFGVLLGKVIAPIVMGIIYYLVLTPVALLRRVFGKPGLQTHFDDDAQSYWIKREPPGPDPSQLPRQF